MRRNQVRKLYREAILQVFGTGDTKLDADLLKALKKDIHYGEEAPGGWSPNSVLEIYCESGIPNATDVHDFRAEAREFGFDPSNAISYNSDKWDEIDGVVNLLLEATGKFERYHHEPQNGAVVNVYLS